MQSLFGNLSFKHLFRALLVRHRPMGTRIGGVLAFASKKILLKL